MMIRHKIGTHVEIVQTGETGYVVGGTVWTANLSEGNDVGDRLVELDSGQRMYFEPWMMRATGNPGLAEWTLAYRIPRAHTFIRITDLNLTWSEASQLGGYLATIRARLLRGHGKHHG